MKETGRICPECLNHHLEAIACPDPNVIMNSRTNRRQLKRIMRKANTTMKKNGFKAEVELSRFQSFKLWIKTKFNDWLKS